jgi:hypothetical protein
MASIKKDLEAFTDEFEGELEKREIFGVPITRNLSIPLCCCCAVVVLIVSISLGAALGEEEGKGGSSGSSMKGFATDDRYPALIELLEPLVGKSITEKGTSENKALEWLANEDAANLPLDSHLDYITQRFVLANLFDATNGRSWDQSYSFMSYKPVCEWNLGDGDDDNGAYCTGGFVTRLMLGTNEVNGTIPNAIGLLTHLEHLDLGHNGLTGTIPKSLELLAKCTHLDLRTLYPLDSP